jgi:hypothetical protein
MADIIITAANLTTAIISLSTAILLIRKATKGD